MLNSKAISQNKVEGVVKPEWFKAIDIHVNIKVTCYNYFICTEDLT